LCSLLTITSCDICDGCDEPPVGAGQFSNGVFVVNEGTFSGSGSVSWLNPATGESVVDVFGSANNGAALGQFAQSLTFIGDRAYVCVGGANRVVVLNANTFEYIDTIGGVQNPRYLLPIGNDQVLLSQWGADGLTGSVLRIQLSTKQVIATIPTGHGPDKLLLRPDNTVLVANSGGFGTDSTVSVINLATNTETQRIAVPGKNPSSLAVGTFGGQEKVYVLCKGSFLDATPKSWVGSLDGQTGYEVAPYSDDLCAAPGGERLYFSAGATVQRLDATGVATFIVQPTYGLAVNAQNGNVYCGNAGDFISAGKLVVYTAGGTKISETTVGIAPGEITVK
jgi:hypothetical protein